MTTTTRKKKTSEMATTEDTDVSVTKSSRTKRIIVPEGMSYKDAREWLTRQEHAEEQEVSIYMPTGVLLFEGLALLVAALTKVFGFFGREKSTTVRVATAHGKHVDVPWGRLTIPGVHGYLEVGFEFQRWLPTLVIQGMTKAKDEPKFRSVVDYIQEHAKTESIYKGCALRMSFDFENASNLFELLPEYIDTSGCEVNNLILPENTQRLVSNALFTPIQYTQACREAKVPLKRGVLLSGPYGVGKTLTATTAARLCEDNGWTFLYLRDVSELGKAIEFAQRYQPCMIFAEDIDQVLGTDERDEDVNEILNTMDGLDTKSSEVFVVLTTNHIERINGAMMRPGRLDAIIEMEPPDAGAALKLIFTYGGGVLRKGEDFSTAATALAGNIPAVIREVVERAKLAAISRTGSSKEHVTNEDLMIAADSLLGYRELMARRNPEKVSDRVKAAEVLGRFISGDLPGDKQTTTSGSVAKTAAAFAS